MKTYGLIGKNIEYSFSKSYFAEKFKSEKLKCEYLNFDINKIDDFHVIFDKIKNLSGLNVTIPFKQSIISKLDNIHKDAKQIGAVNTIKFTGNELIGYNTDHLGFKESITPFLKAEHKNALILGTGGAAKAVEFAFKSMNIKTIKVTRDPQKKGCITYKKLTETVIKNNQIIVNCTPLGTFPKTEMSPKIPYNAIKNYHLLYDLIYNPELTKFLKFGIKSNATTINGINMLKIQAEKSWEIWNSDFNENIII